ncbi:MAG: hypothetical protein ACJAVT_002337 [Yoonia sp.]|jgi:hypothetical protein
MQKEGLFQQMQALPGGRMLLLPSVSSQKSFQIPISTVLVIADQRAQRANEFPEQSNAFGVDNLQLMKKRPVFLHSHKSTAIREIGGIIPLRWPRL